MLFAAGAGPAIHGTVRTGRGGRLHDRPAFRHNQVTVGHLGLFTSHGRFTKFDATLNIDPDHPERTRIVVDVDAVSVNMPWQDGVAMLRSPAYFDVQRYPEVEFRSPGVSPHHLTTT